MRLDFKRFLSGVLALVMMTSALTMVNVSSVMAAVNTDKWMASETLPTGGWLAFTKGFSYNAQYSSNKEETFVDGTFDSGDGNEDSPQKQPYYGPAAVGSTFTITTKGNAELDIYAVVNNSGDATLSVSGADEGNATTGDNTIHQKGTKGIKPIHYQLKGADTYTFTTATKKDVCIFRIDLITSDGGEEETGYTWTLDDSKLKAVKMDTVASKLNFSSSTLSDRNILTLDNTEDTGYSLLPGVKTLYNGLTDIKGVEIVTSGDTEKSFVITPTPDMFMKHVRLALDDISITGGANRVLHLTCETHTTTYSILLGDAEDDQPAHASKMLVSKDEYGGYELSDEIDIPVHGDTYKATMGGGHLDTDTFTLSEENKKITATYTQLDRTAITDTVSGIDFTKLRTTSEAAAERLMGGTVVGTVGDSEDINYMRVVGEGYQNVYALSGTAEEHGNFAKAITIRSIGDDMAETGAVAGGGLGFSIGTDDAVGGADTRFKVTVSAVAIKDRKSPGVDSELGLAEIASDDVTGSEKVGTPLEQKKITGIEDNTNFEEKADYIFETELEPGKSYVLYNYGNVTEEGNIRIYSVSFEKTKSGTSTPGTVVFKDSYNPTGSSITAIDNTMYLDAAYKFKANASKTDNKGMSIDQSGNHKIDLANGDTLNPAKGRLKTGGSGSAKDEENGRNIVFETEEAGDVYVYAAASSTPKEGEERYLVLSDGSTAPQNGENLSDSSYNVDKFTVEANKKYYLYSGKSGINIFYIGSTAALKPLKETSPTAVKVKFNVEGGMPNSITYIYKNDSTSNPEKLDKTNNPSVSLQAEPGDKFIISGEYKASSSGDGSYGTSLPDNVYKWEPINAKESKSSILFHNGKESNHNERYFIYTVPETATAADGDYGVKFTVASDITMLNEDTNITGDLASTISGLNKTIGLGTYGFGEDKATLYGNDARKIVAYSFQTASANDYTSAGAGGTIYNNMDPEGYTTKGTEYAILNSEKTGSQYFIFKTGNWTNYANPDTNECTAIIESSVNGIKVEKLTEDGSSDNSTQADQKFETTGQHNVTLKPNSIYRVTALNKTDHKSGDSTLSYVKSIRITDPNNIFDSPVFERLEENQAVVSQKGNAVEQEVKDLLTSDGESSIEDTDTVFRIISEISLQGDNNGTEQVEFALSQIKAVGYDVYDKDTYNKLNELMMTYETSKSYFNATNSSAINGHLDSKGLSDTDLKPKDVIIFGDVVNTAVDTIHTTDPGEPTADIGTIGDTSKLFVQTYYKIATGGSAKALIPWVSYDYAGGSSDYTKIYTISNQEGGNDPARILDPAAE